MKHYLLLVLTICFYIASALQATKTKNVFIVTIDGIRWQEIFKGADQEIINNSRYTSDVSLAKMMYLDSSVEQNRKKLLPFFWNVIEQQGRPYGNREHKNKVNVFNGYKFSYPGYNEILSGYADIRVTSNEPENNLNINVLEFLNSIEEFNNKIAAFTSWDIFPYILNKERSGVPIYSGYDSVAENDDFDLHIFNKAQENLIPEKGSTRMDILTFIAASEYIKVNKPKVVYIGFGECDEDAHNGEYDKYLQHLNEADKMIQQLWYYIQSTPEYKDKSTLIITTDHGRGKKKNKWTDHDVLVKGSGDTWIAIMGPDTSPKGEMQLPQQLYQRQIASTISLLLGFNFTANHPVSVPLDFIGTR
ncbi:MAG: hypothetical protein ABI691_22325 [Ginsengibacter sp.]